METHAEVTIINIAEHDRSAVPEGAASCSQSFNLFDKNQHQLKNQNQLSFNLFRTSPVYSDRLFYRKVELCSRHVALFQSGDLIFFKPVLDGSNIVRSNQDFMPDFSVQKAMATGVLQIEHLDLETRAVVTEENLNEQNEENVNNEDGENVNNENVNIGKEVTNENTAKFGPILGEKKIEVGDNFGDKEMEEMFKEPLIILKNFRRIQKRNEEKTRDPETVKVIKFGVAYCLIFVVALSVTFYVVYFS